MRGAGQGPPADAVLTEDAGFRQAPYQRQDPLVPDALAHPPHQGGVIDLVEARLDVRLENPLVIRGPRGELVYLGDRVLRPSSGPEPVRGRVEVGFEDRLQHQFQRRPDDPVRHGGDPQAADLAARLGDPPAAHPLGREPPGPHPSAQIGQDGERARRRHVAGDDPARLRRCARPCCCAHDPRATTRNAGPVHEVEAGHPKRRPGSAAAHRCSFVCITSTRCHAPLTSAGHGTPVFTSVSPPPCSRLPRTRAGPLRHATGSPGPGLLRVLRPPPPAPVGDEPVRPRTAGRRTRAGTGSGAPRAHHVISRRDRHPVMPLHLRRDRAADVGHGLPAGDILRPGSHSGRRCTGGRVRDATQPPSARFRVGGN